ncbi:hypothetical protein RFI_16458 [Reticulomyxa filosa]|nr:hypothetical protein RFI_16458 [Reticulomyxa filosa]|eukprot:ETO20762.1 hypothetical protein RFI_16458 [Reticulomyxa filosa]
MESLEYLWLHSNELNNKKLSFLSNNMFFYSNHKFSGIIPSNIDNIANLKYLRLNEKKLTGSIPVEIKNLKNLTYIVLSNNLLSTKINTFLKKLIEMK